jgi:MarR family transcriptional regulator, 2-MHQ and catechol-resistance regulon repressor
MRFVEDLSVEEIDVMKRVSGLPVNVRAMGVLTNVWRAAQALKTVAERTVLKEFGLSWASFSTLYIVWIWGPIETRDIARSQGVARATVTSAIDTLERKGLVQRQPHASDRRLVTVRLTERGSSTIESVYPQFNRVEAAIVEDLPVEEQERLADLLRIVIRSTFAFEQRFGSLLGEDAHDGANGDR